MYKPPKKEILFAQIMFIPLGFFPPLIMFLIINIFEFHLAYGFMLLSFETIILIDVVIKVFLNKPYSYPDLDGVANGGCYNRRLGMP